VCDVRQSVASRSLDDVLGLGRADALEGDTRTALNKLKHILLSGMRLWPTNTVTI
jgi:hypothetical protein